MRMREQKIFEPKFGGGDVTKGALDYAIQWIGML